MTDELRVFHAIAAGLRSVGLGGHESMYAHREFRATSKEPVAADMYAYMSEKGYARGDVKLLVILSAEDFK